MTCTYITTRFPLYVFFFKFGIFPLDAGCHVDYIKCAFGVAVATQCDLGINKICVPYIASSFSDSERKKHNLPNNILKYYLFSIVKQWARKF